MTRTVKEVRARREQVVVMLSKGIRQTEMAQKLNVSNATITMSNRSISHGVGSISQGLAHNR